jgi:predicted outer membrane repeat protein
MGSNSGVGIAVVNNSFPTLFNCKISGNILKSNKPGAGIYIDKTSSGNFTYCIVSHNLAYGDFGGGVFIESEISEKIRFDKCNFIKNESGKSGSAIYASARLDMYDCFITANRIRSSEPSGAIHLFGESTNLIFRGISYTNGNGYNHEQKDLKGYEDITGREGRLLIEDDAWVGVRNKSGPFDNTMNHEFMKPEIKAVMQDLFIPDLSDERPAPGKRVRLKFPEYLNTEVYHSLYLPPDWNPDERIPVMVNFPGNGPFASRFASRSGGFPESSPLGFGLSEGKFIDLGLPYIAIDSTIQQGGWWGDVKQTITYCIRAVRQICEEYGGDPSAVILTGFSRSAVGSGFIGRHTKEINDIWLAFFNYDGFDHPVYLEKNNYRYGINSFNYDPKDNKGTGSDTRFERIRGRAHLVINHGKADDIEKVYLKRVGSGMDYIYELAKKYKYPVEFHGDIYRNHNATWVLRNTKMRKKSRDWLQNVLGKKPGTFTISGRVTNGKGKGIEGVRIQGGSTHFTFTDKDGKYDLNGLIKGERILIASKNGNQFEPVKRLVKLLGEDLLKVDFKLRR